MKPDIAKKLLCLGLAACLAVFTACGGGEGGQDSTDTHSSGEEPESVVVKDGSEWIEELDDAGGAFKGKKLNVVSVSQDLFLSEEENPIGRAVTYRNGLLQQYFDISIGCVEKDAETIKKELKAAVDKGEPYADLICAPVSVLATFAADGLLENVYSLPYMDFSADYIEKSALEGVTARNTAYFYCGELTNSLNAGVGIFYNKALVNAAGADPVKLARTGGLTWSALITMAQSVAEHDAYGIDSLLTENDLAVAIYGSSGKGFISAGSGNAPVIVYDADAARGTATVMESLFKDPKYSAGLDSENALKAFKNGNLGFIVATMDSVSLLDGCKSEWGLLPLPKHSAEQAEYSSFVSNNALAVAVPRGCSDSAFSGFVLNALIASSSNAIELALKTTYINYHFWSNDAAVMLNVIGRTKRLDMGVAYSSVQEVAGVGTSVLIKDDNQKVSDNAINNFNELAAGLFY